MRRKKFGPTPAPQNAMLFGKNRGDQHSSRPGILTSLGGIAKHFSASYRSAVAKSSAITLARIRGPWLFQRGFNGWYLT